MAKAYRQIIKPSFQNDTLTTGVQKAQKQKYSKHVQKVWEACYLIPKGKVTTYKSIALAIGSAPRAVGQGLRHNCFAPQVPCHRVVNNQRDIHGFDGHLDKNCEFVQEKVRLLESEGIKFKNYKVDAEYVLDAYELQKLIRKAKQVELEKNGSTISLFSKDQ